jgi:leucyl-tRNA synthetase
MKIWLQIVKGTMSKVYDHVAIEEKWEKVWEDTQLFQGTAVVDDKTKEKLFLLFAFAYPSGAGLHVGHVESKTALDILARFNRMKDKNVFFPVGWDAFGLPAENYAIKTGIPPVKTTKDAINTFRRQIKRLGISYDWKTELATCHPEYYKWTQWIFLELYKKGLAYQAIGMVNWCPSCQTVLANEQVVNGACERCGTEVVQKEMKQWFFKITKYKDELISGLETVDWPQPTKDQQLNWIGKSSGVKIDFQIKDSEQILTCFTTRIDTVFGVTFLVISPEKFNELNLSKKVPAQTAKKVAEYIEKSFKKTEEERKIGEKDKTGVDTGITVLNPVSGEAVPVYVADYVLAGYGTGVVMGVPAHDERDNAFAKKFTLPVVPVIKAPEESTTFFSGYGELINSGKYTGMTSEQAQEKIVADFSSAMEIATTYKLRDWLISRQRYWGVPIPIVYDPEGNAHPVKEEHLPWMLPTDVEFKPTGESPLTYSKEFLERTEALYGKGWRPEFDTMDTFVDSSWYFLRYVDARNPGVFASAEQLKLWEPVDFYMIGPEHIVLHLLYSRFFTKFLRDQGYLKFDEPFMKMRHQGMILGPDGKKMSKSKGNVINPDEVIEKFGADTLRTYEMFMGPIEADKPWDVSAVAGVYRFLQRIHRLVHDSAAQSSSTKKLATEGIEAAAVRQKLHQTIKKVSSDIPDLKFNTSIAFMMEFSNSWERAFQAGQTLTPEEQAMFIKVLAPFAPFLAEELYQVVMPGAETIHTSSWPAWDEATVQTESVTVGVQVNGKVRAELVIAQADRENSDKVLAEAKAIPAVQPWLEGKTIVKEIYVPGKIVSIAVK